MYKRQIHRIINKNRDLFDDKKAMDVLASVDNLNLVYLSFSSKEAEAPMLVYEMTYMGNIYYFNTESGKLMMVR